MWLRKRLVRVHFTGDVQPSLEGVLVSASVDGHYVLRAAKLWEAEDRSSQMGEVLVPREKVLFMQRLSS